MLKKKKREREREREREDFWLVCARESERDERQLQKLMFISNKRERDRERELATDRNGKMEFWGE